MAIDRDKVLEAAQALVEKKRYDKAIVEYQKVLAADPKDARVLLKIGEAYARAEQYEKAIATFEQVAQLHATQGFALKAVAAYVQARDIVVRFVPHLTDRFGYLVFRIAELYVQLRRNNDAIQIYEETAARLDAAGRQRDALDILKKVVELDPKNADRAYRLGEGLLRLGDTDAAVPHLGAAAEGLVARGQHDDAIALLERVLAVRADPKLARLAAQLYLDRGGPKDAGAAFLKIQIAYKHAPKDLDTLGLLARALTVLRQPERAIDVHKEAARVARELGNTDVFDQHMETLASRAPNDPAVRKLATSWSKAPAWLLDPAGAPPGPRLPQAPPRAPITQPTPPEVAPYAPPMPPPEAYGPPMAPPQAAPYAPPMPAQRLTPPTPPPLQRLTPPTPPPLQRLTPPTPQPQQRLTPPTPQPQQPPAPPRMPPPLPPRGGPPPPPPQRQPTPPPGPLPGMPPPQRQHTPLPGPLPGGPPLPRQPTPPPGPLPGGPAIVEPAPPPRMTPIPLIPRMTPPPTPARGPAAPPPAPPRLENFGEIDEPQIEELAPPTPPAQPAPPAHLAPPGPPVHAAPEIPAIEAPDFPEPDPDPASGSWDGPKSFAGRGGFDEEALEEVDFFVSQRMFEDAIGLLDEQLARLPGHPLLLDRRREIQEMADAEATGGPVDPWGGVS